MLLEMLKNSKSYQELTDEQKEITMRLAEQFEENAEHTLHLSPTELTQTLEIGNKRLWQDFLNLEATRNYIKTQMAEMAQIAHRKAFQALQREAVKGDTTAARQINELSGILNNVDNNRIVVLHYIDRSEESEKTN
jgi:Txe/YoeB family toxin of Txe-Axe toxin-antitoxin module